MAYRMKAIYRQGAFIPDFPCDLPDNSRVDLVVQMPNTAFPQVTSPEERTRILKQITDRMKRNPLPAEAGKYSRNQLHERP